MKALKVIFGIFIFFIVIILIVIFLAFSTPVKLVKYNTNVDLQEQLLILASSSVGSRIVVSEELLNDVAGSILAEQLGNTDIEEIPVSFGGMNLHLDNGVISVYTLLNFKPETFVPSWIKRIMVSGQFEIISDSDDIVVVLKKVRLGRLPLPVKTIIRYVDYQEVPDGIDIQNLSYTISNNTVSKMISENIEISKLDIGNEELSFFLSFNSEKMGEIIDSIAPLINKGDELFSQIKDNIPSGYSGIVADGELVLDILKESVDSQDSDIVPAAYISWFEGDVTVQNQDAGETTIADFGMEVETGAVIKTGTDSNVEIVLPDRSLIILQSDTYIILEQVYFDGKAGTAKTSISLGFGRVRSVVKKMVTTDSLYEIITPTGVAGVRGTDFGVSYSSDNKSVEIIVLSGKINLVNNEGDSLVMESDTIASIDRKGKISGIKSLNSTTRNLFIQQIPINTVVAEGTDNKFSVLLPIVLRIMRTWDSMSYEEQQVFIGVLNDSSELESLFNELDIEELQRMILK